MRAGAKAAIGWIVFFGIFAAVGALAWRSPEAAAMLRGWMESLRGLGFMAFVVYFAIYVVLATLSAPTTPLNVGAGVLFSYPVAVLVALLAGATAATTTFLFARYVAAAKIRDQLDGERWSAVFETVDEQGFKIVLLARLNPLIPAAVKNYGFGVTTVPLRKYIAATLLGQLPIVLLHVYLGWGGGTAITSQDNSGLNLLLIVSGVALSAVLLVVMWWYGSRKLMTTASPIPAKS